jgi:hypothetical protein
MRNWRSQSKSVACYGWRCWRSRVPPRPLPGHRMSPPQAVWAGGPDGGSWFVCTVDERVSGDVCTVYEESHGIVLAQGPFRLRRTGRAARTSELRYEFFDGRSIYLIGGRVLDPVTSPEPTRKDPE